MPKHVIESNLLVRFANMCEHVLKTLTKRTITYVAFWLKAQTCQQEVFARIVSFFPTHPRLQERGSWEVGVKGISPRQH